MSEFKLEKRSIDDQLQYWMQMAHLNMAKLSIAVNYARLLREEARGEEYRKALWDEMLNRLEDCDK